MVAPARPKRGSGGAARCWHARRRRPTVALVYRFTAARARRSDPETASTLQACSGVARQIIGNREHLRAREGYFFERDAPIGQCVYYVAPVQGVGDQPEDFLILLHFLDRNRAARPPFSRVHEKMLVEL